MKKTAIFDMDGTLLDTLEDLYQCTNYALRTHGLKERTKDEVRQFVGNGIRNLLIRAVEGGEGHPKFEACFQTFHEYYKDHCLDTTRPYPGVSELLEQLKKEGFLIAIVSNKADYAVKELQRKFFGALVEVAIGEREGIRRKPAPDTVQEAVQELGSCISDAVYIGDSDVDLKTAKNAEIPCISVLWGFRDREFLKECGATVFARNTEELKQLLIC